MLYANGLLEEARHISELDVIAVWMVFSLSGAESPRAKPVVALVTVRSARLGYHLFSRWA